MSIPLMAGWSNGSRVMTSENSRYNDHATVTRSHRNRFQRSYHQSCDWHQIRSAVDDFHCRSDGAALEVELEVERQRRGFSLSLSAQPGRKRASSRVCCSRTEFLRYLAGYLSCSYCFRGMSDQTALAKKKTDEYA